MNTVMSINIWTMTSFCNYVSVFRHSFNLRGLTKALHWLFRTFKQSPFSEAQKQLDNWLTSSCQVRPVHLLFSNKWNLEFNPSVKLVFGNLDIGSKEMLMQVKEAIIRLKINPSERQQKQQRPTTLWILKKKKCTGHFCNIKISGRPQQS